MRLRWLIINILLVVCVSHNSYADNNDIINIWLIAKDDVIVVSDGGVNNKIYKGTHFVIKEDNIARRDNGRVLLHDVRYYPYDGLINGWINLEQLTTVVDAKKVSNWPFKVWKVDMRSVINWVYEFNLDGGAEFYSLEEVDHGIQKTRGHVYLVDDIAIVKYQIRGFEQNLPFAIYDKSNGRLCPLGRDIRNCGDHLTSKDFYLEKHK